MRNSQACGVRLHPAHRTDGEQHRLHGEQRDGVRRGEQQHGHQDDGGQGGGELRAAGVDRALRTEGGVGTRGQVWAWRWWSCLS